VITVGAGRKRHLPAQVRRALGLSLLTTLCGASPSDPLKSVIACREVSDATARLACFDRETAALAAAPPAPVASAPRVPPAPPGPVAAPPSPPPLDAEQRFGLPERAVAEKEIAAGLRSTEAAKIEAHIAQVTTAPDGRTVFRLDNNQTWRQLLSEGDLLSKVGDAVTISRGALGSYWLHVASGRGCKVTRVR
jgi:hypothetical protein